MEKSGSGTSNPEIKDSWRLKSRSRILLESLLTVAFWTGFIYLLLPMITLFLWIFGVRIAYTELIGSQGLLELVKIIKSSVFVIFVVTVLLLSWSYYNYMLFRVRGERRNSRVMICFDEDFAARFHLDPKIIGAAKEERRLEIHLKEDGLEVKGALGSLLPTGHPAPAKARDQG
ncbi:MAG: poly-beta-1,6-N-acetyl-D-glucosamine biosynthesis protein PgaD [Desulfobaccales bacterium]